MKTDLIIIDFPSTFSRIAPNKFSLFGENFTKPYAALTVPTALPDTLHDDVSYFTAKPKKWS